MPFFLLALAVATVSTLGCRPKKRPIKILGNTPSVVVAVDGMNEFGKEDYSYKMTKCVEAEGEPRADRNAVSFKHADLQLDMPGCVLKVSREKAFSQGTIKFLRENQLYWLSNEFAIGQNQDGELVAVAKMEKVYSNAGAKPPNTFDLTFTMQLPEGTDTSAFVSATGTLRCGPPVSDVHMNQLVFDSERRASHMRSDFKFEHLGAVVRCNRVTVLAKNNNGTQSEFALDLAALGDKAAFSPKASQIVALNEGNPLQLSLLATTPLPSAGGPVRVTVHGNCPVDRPWLDVGDGTTQPVCKPCPDKTQYSESQARCVPR